MTSRVSENNPDDQEIMRKSTGKIFKGTINDAPMKIKVASIPSKFQNVVYRNNKPPAFGNSRDRFYSQQENVKKYQPGPGNYQNSNKTQQKIFSKKGYGSLISNTKLDRLQKRYTGLPGPGSYNPKTALLSRTMRSSSLALLSSKLQGHELFKTQVQKSKAIPAVGIYNLRMKKSNSQSHAFSNNIDRFNTSIQNEQTPGVGHYHYEISSVKQIQNTLSPKIRYKKAGAEINEISYQQKLKVVRQILNTGKKNSIESQKNVGPGAYNIKSLDKKIGYKIYETSYDRFGETIDKNIKSDRIKQSQNNNDQQISMYVTDDVYNPIVQVKQVLSSSKGLTSMFKSNLARYNFVKSNINDPAKYSPQKPDKKSHLINYQKKWI